MGVATVAMEDLPPVVGTADMEADTGVAMAEMGMAATAEVRLRDLVCAVYVGNTVLRASSCALLNFLVLSMCRSYRRRMPALSRWRIRI